MHVNMADSPIPVPDSRLPPDSPLVMKNSRHPITEAGFDTIVADARRRGLDGARDRARRSPTRGSRRPPPLDQPCHKIERHNAGGRDLARLPRPRDDAARDGPGRRRPTATCSNATVFRDVEAEPARTRLGRGLRPRPSAGAPSQGPARPARPDDRRRCQIDRHRSPSLTANRGDDHRGRSGQSSGLDAPTCLDLNYLVTMRLANCHSRADPRSTSAGMLHSLADLPMTSAPNSPAASRLDRP